MRPGMQLLLEVLRGSQPQTPAADDWTALLTLAEQENVLPLVAERLRVLNVPRTAEQELELEAIRRQAQLTSFVWVETLKTVLVAFDKAGVPAVSLKGPCLAERLYGDAALRTCYDLDLLVKPADLARADAILAEIGFSPQGDADDYHRRWRRKGVILELHRDVENPEAFRLDLGGMWQRTRVTAFQGVPIQLLSPEDELLYLCLHAVRHRFERLYLMQDLALAFHQVPASAALEDTSKAGGLDNVLLLGRMMAAHLDPQVKVSELTRVQPRNRRRLQRLADLLWDERMRDPAQMLDWNAQHRFYVAVENPGWRRMERRWRHLRILLARLIDEDFLFAQQFHLRRNWQVWLLRPIRLLIKAVRPAAHTI